MSFIQLVITVCTIANPTHCEARHLEFASAGSLLQCVNAAPPYIARWIGYHPKWRAVRWTCEYPHDAHHA